MRMSRVYETRPISAVSVVNPVIGTRKANRASDGIVYRRPVTQVIGGSVRGKRTDRASVRPPTDVPSVSQCSTTLSRISSGDQDHPQSTKRAITRSPGG
jgi:hypothetical protein